jgi:hypothetical protein
MHCQCKLSLHWQLIRMLQPSMSYQESDVKWGDMTENMIVSGWQCKIILHIVCTYSFYPFSYVCFQILFIYVCV